MHVQNIAGCLLLNLARRTRSITCVFKNTPGVCLVCTGRGALIISLPLDFHFRALFIYLIFFFWQISFETPR